MEASERPQLPLDDGRAGDGSVRAIDDRLVIERLEVADAGSARVVREQAAEGRSPGETVTRAIEIGTRVIDGEGTAANVDYVRREVQATLGELNTELAETLAEGNTELAERIAAAFGADRNDSVQQQIKQIIDGATDRHRHEITKLLSAEDKSNPLVAIQARMGKAILESDERHRQEMSSIREAHSKEARAMQGQVSELKEHLARLLDKRDAELELAEAEDAGTRKGRTFEQRVGDAIDRLAAGRGDSIHLVGDERGAGGSKKGDVVVGIGGAEGTEHGRIAFEVKDSQLSKPKAWAELNGALAARAADFAVLVVAGEENVPPGQEQLHEYEGNKLIVAVHADDPDQLGLELAYRFARCRVLLAREDDLAVDAAGVRTATSEARAALAEARNIKSLLTTAKNSVEKARTGVESIEAAVIERLDRIESLVAAAAEAEPD